MKAAWKWWPPDLRWALPAFTGESVLPTPFKRRTGPARKPGPSQTVSGEAPRIFLGVHDPKQVEDYDKLTAIIRPTVVQVANAGLHKAGDVSKKVEAALQPLLGKSFRFNASYHHAKACEFYKVRPKKGDPHPEKTKIEFCHFDAAHKDYVFTDNWVRYLIEEVKKPNQLDAGDRGMGVVELNRDPLGQHHQALAHCRWIVLAAGMIEVTAEQVGNRAGDKEILLL